LKGVADDAAGATNSAKFLTMEIESIFAVLTPRASVIQAEE
jgi:hypothetical protein